MKQKKREVLKGRKIDKLCTTFVSEREKNKHARISIKKSRIRKQKTLEVKGKNV